jgi:SAM-dependent methyltransferase
LFEELDHSDTSLGELILRRRRYVGLDAEVYELKLGDDFLMSSLFTASEEALGRLGVQHACRNRAGAEGTGADDAKNGGVDVVVGGLGLGYTAAAVLESQAVRSLLVVEYLEPVIEWHRRGMLPVSATLTGDERFRIVSSDFFASAFSEVGFAPSRPGRRFDAVLCDIDHSPDAWLDPANDSLYQVQGLRSLKRHLRPGGVFGLWSNDPPDGNFRGRMATAFAAEWAEPVAFHNPLQNREVTQTVYIGVREAE